MDHTTPAPASPDTASPAPRIIRRRIANACDGCKARKVKCDGRQPCTYCVRRQRQHACHYAQPRRPRQRRPSVTSSEGPPLPQSPPHSTASLRASASSSTRDASLLDDDSSGRRVESPALQPQSDKIESAEDDTEVPREARLLCDPQGQLIFIGDCAPLSLFQSIRQLVTSRISQNAFAPETSRYSVLENAAALTPSHHSPNQIPPNVRPIDNVASVVSSYVSATTGLVDLFDESSLTDDLRLWVDVDQKPQNLTSVINYLILAIGGQKDDETSSQIYFEYARNQAFATLSGNLSVGTVQAFILMTVYMLCSCQINSAFLVFGVAARAAYSIGLHRTEVNARFGPEMHRQRDRLWKSLRIVDLFLSTSMGRPPATSDVDCTVPYRSVEEGGTETFDLLNASVQILLITEGIVTKIYSRKKISLLLTEGVSLQLREWSARWLRRLREVVTRPSDHPQSQVSGACQVLSSYYYAVILVSRPFLMYELFRRLSDGPDPTSVTPPVLTSGKSKLADACIDAASLMVEPILDLVEKRLLSSRMPLLVSWLFASSLVLGVGLLGGFGRILEKHTRMSIQALDYFAKSDTHATQYSLIAQSLLTTALAHLEKRELQERLRRTESSSQLFGFIPHDDGHARRNDISFSDQSNTPTATSPVASVSRRHEPPERSYLPHQQRPFSMSSPRAGDVDAIFGLGDSLMGHDGNFWNTYQDDGDSGLTLNLFPLLEAGGGIDLAHYL